MPVNKLDAKTTSQIAAGEVVENPASVIKELLENALDAGASRIKVVLKKGGLEEITVLDDGSGISAADLRLALERHATSKITALKDLEQVNTLGFRGEALPSIAAVSRLSLTTCHKEAETGSYIYLEGAEEKVFKETGFPRGTMVQVKDLFFNVPVRRKFLRSTAAESAQATRIIELLALSHPHISFTLERDGRVHLETPGDGSVFNTVLQLFGHKLAPHLLPVQLIENNYKLEGYVSAPSLSLKSRSHQLFYVNRRHVRNRLFRDALEQTFARFVTAKRYPLAFLFLSVSPEELDVNVHPAKIEVRFREEKKIYDFLSTGITKAYMETHKKTTAGQDNIFVGRPQEQALNLFSRMVSEGSAHVREVAPEPQQYVPDEKQEQTKKETDTKKSLPTQEKSQEAPKSAMPVLSGARQILCQLFSSYILLEQEDELVLMDQHAAHERILWEECLKRRAGEKQYTQEVLPFPQEVHLNLSKDYISAEKLKLLAELGLELEQFGNNSFIIRSVPFFLKDIFTAQMLTDIVQELANSNYSGKPDWQEAVLLQLTCKAAVKANDYLTMEEMEGLLKQLEECDNPYYCPHGRPVMIRYTRKELEKIFHRR